MPKFFIGGQPEIEIPLEVFDPSNWNDDFSSTTNLGGNLKRHKRTKKKYANKAKKSRRRKALSKKA